MKFIITIYNLINLDELLLKSSPIVNGIFKHHKSEIYSSKEYIIPTKNFIVPSYPIGLIRIRHIENNNSFLSFFSKSDYSNLLLSLSYYQSNKVFYAAGGQWVDDIILFKEYSNDLLIDEKNRLD